MAKKLGMFLFTMLTILCLGLVYGWSVFVAPLEAEFGWQRSETSLTFTISIVTMCLGIMAGGQFNKYRNKPLISLLIAAVLLLAGFCMVSRAQSLMAFYVFYGVFCGFGVGFAYVELIALPTKWFPGRQGLTSGILMMCFGLGAMILGTICSNVMGTLGWRTVFLALGILFGGLVFVDGLILQGSLKMIDHAKAKSGVSASDDEGSITTGEMVKSKDFVFLYLWHISISAAGLALMGHIAPCAMQIGASATTAALVAGVVSIANGGGRIIYGFLYDLLGVRKTMMIISCVFLIATIITAAAVSSGSIPLLIAGCVFTGISFGASPTSNSAVVNRFYGPKYFSANFGIVSTQLIFAAMIGPFLAGKMYGMTSNYISTFYGVIGLGVISIVLALLVTAFAKKNGRKLDR